MLGVAVKEAWSHRIAFEQEQQLFPIHVLLLPPAVLSLPLQSLFFVSRLRLSFSQLPPQPYVSSSLVLLLPPHVSFSQPLPIVSLFYVTLPPSFVSG